MEDNGNMPGLVCAWNKGGGRGSVRNFTYEVVISKGQRKDISLPSPLSQREREIALMRGKTRSRLWRCQAQSFCL